MRLGRPQQHTHGCTPPHQANTNTTTPHHGTVRCQFLRFARIPEVLASKKLNTTCSQAKTQYIILGGPSLAFQFPMTAETSILHLGHVHRIKSIFLHIVLHHFLWLMSWKELFSHAGGAGTRYSAAPAPSMEHIDDFFATRRSEIVLHDFSRWDQWKQ